jgi:hypothetical protein
MPQDTPPPSTTPDPGILLYAPPPLVHAGEGADAEALRRDAADHLARWPALQVMAEVLNLLRGAGVSWWAAAALIARWPITERLRWLEQRWDLREQITRSLTNVTLRDPRRRSVTFQAELIEATIDPAVDADAQRVDEAFDPRDVVVYGPVVDLWDEAMRRIPWDGEMQPALVEQLIALLLAERSAALGTTRPAILSPWRLRTAIDTRAWQAHVPARVRAAVDEARLHKELVSPGAPFTARDELAIVTTSVLAASLPLRALRPVFSAAARVMGLEPHVAPSESQPAPKNDFAAVANDSDLEVTVSTGS